jgi:hypothetical protein
VVPVRALPFGETVTLRRRVLAVEDGEVVRDGYGVAQYTDQLIEVRGCAVAPAGSMGQAFSFEAVGQRFSQVSTRYVVEFPPGVEADADDKVIWRGDEYEIEGEPGYSRSPFSGRPGPVETYIKRTTG